MLAVIACLLGGSMVGVRGARGQPWIPDLPFLIEGPELKPDPAVSQGTLPSGLRVLIREHAAPAGQVVLKLQIHAGSLHEEAAGAGAAFAAARLAMHSASERPTGRALRSLGAALPDPGRWFGVATSFDTTVFTVTLPLADESALVLAAEHLRSILSEPVTEASIAGNRAALIGDASAAATLVARHVRATMPRIAPQTALAVHTPFPPGAEVCEIGSDVVIEYCRRWYRASNASVVVAGDVESRRVARILERSLGRLPSKEGPDEPRVELQARAASRAVVVSDAEQVHAVVEMVVVNPAVPPLRTEAALFEVARDALAARVMRGRLLSRADAPGGAKQVSASSGPGAGRLRFSLASVTGDAVEWRTLVEELGAEVRSLRSRAVSREEMASAAEGLKSDLRRSIADVRSAPAAVLAEWDALALRRGDVVLDPAVKASLIEASLEMVDEATLRATLDWLFDAERACVALFLPKDVAAPSEAEVLEASQGVYGPRREMRASEERPTSISDVPVRGGVIERLVVDPLTGVTSARLPSGAAVHFRRLGAESRRVVITLGLRTKVEGGGAAAAWASGAVGAVTGWPATRSRSSSELRRLLASSSIELRGDVGRGVVTLEVSSEEKDFELSCELLAALVREPLVEPAALDRWQWSTLGSMAAARVRPVAAAEAEVERAAAAGGAALDERWVREVTAEAAQRWLESVLMHAPIEVGVAGPIDRGRALGGVAGALEGLPRRPEVGRVMTGGADEMGVGARAATGMRRVVVDAPASQAVVVVGMGGSGARTMLEERRLALAARLIPLRWAARGVQPAQPRWSVTAGHRGEGESGLLYAATMVDRALAEDAAARLGALFDALAREGPTDEELIVARAQAASDLDRDLADPRFWSRLMASGGPGGGELSELIDLRQRLVSTRAEDMKQLLTERDVASRGEGARFTLIVESSGGAGAAEETVSGVRRP
ncbi:MAG: insulinase family protein [Planctomycetota bacterium]|nr:insulinase family protein [Planctomycetota bacterium]